MQEPKHDSSQSMLARGVAPIKASYRKTSVKKPIDTDETALAESHRSDENGSHQASKVAPERKSRRAYKRVMT